MSSPVATVPVTSVELEVELLATVYAAMARRV